VAYISLSDSIVSELLDRLCLYSVLGVDTKYERANLILVCIGSIYRYREMFPWG
jgi:hypothetical protein